MRILLTGFEPFGGDEQNASSEAVWRMGARWCNDAQLVPLILPVTFDFAAFEEAVKLHTPDAIVAVGEAGSRDAITIERWAVNQQRARIPDNSGAAPQGKTIVEGGEIRRPSTLDVDAVVNDLRAEGWAAEASEDAGRFVCNTIAYVAYGCGVPAVFVHVPALRSSGKAAVGNETGGTTSANGRLAETFDDLAEALEIVVRSLIPS